MMPNSAHAAVWAAIVLVPAIACSHSPTQPEVGTCSLGPITVPRLAPAACAPAAPTCPLPRPAGATTLVAMVACDFETGTTPCATPVSVCPVLTPAGIDVPFRVSDSDSICFSTVTVHLQPTASGGIDIDWRAQERLPTPQLPCSSAGTEILGHGSVDGPCCSATIEVTLPTTRRTFRATVQADWQNSSVAQSTAR
jgi:hypothetical protein